MLSKLAVEVRVDGEDETDTGHVHEEDNEETRHRVLACVPSVAQSRKVGGTNPKGQTNPKCLNARLTETCAETCFVPH